MGSSGRSFGFDSEWIALRLPIVVSCDNGRDREWLLGYLLDQGSKGDLKMRGEEDQWMDWRASLKLMLQIK